MKKFLLIISILIISSSVWASNFESAEKYIEVGNNAEALEILKSINPKNIDELARQSYLIGKIYFALGKINRAEEFFTDASMKNPGEGQYEAALAEAMLALGNLKDATRILDRVIKSDPDIISAYLTLATIEERLGKTSQAKKRFEDLISRQPHSEIAHVAYAKFLGLRISQAKAIELLSSYLKRYPKSPKAHDQLGQLYSFIGYQTKAIESKQKAVKIYRERGQTIYAEAIDEWLNEFSETSSLEAAAEVNIETSLNKNHQLQKPSIKFQSTNILEPWPIKKGEYTYTGSGFITGNGELVVTNRHVVEGAKKVYVRNGFGIIKKAKIIKVSDVDDIALLQLEESYDQDYAQTIPQNYTVKPGQKIYVIGYPLADLLGESKPSITQGIISKDTGMNDNPALFQLTAKLNSGNSGGPIVSSKGNIVGIAVSKLDKTNMLQEDGMIPEDVNFGIHINRIERFVGDSSSQLFTEELPLENLYEALLPSIVMVLSIVDASK